MRRGTTARFDRSAGGSRRRSIRELLAGIRGGARLAVAIGLLACLGGEGLKAHADPHKLIVQRSTRAIPHKFTVHPDEATVTVNSTQRFEVTDAQGNPVAVHWNVSGIGCSGAGCGSIDDQGVYRTPSSLPQPRIVTVEGVLVSDPNYSVLTQVVLKDPVTVARSATPGHVAAATMQPFAAPEIGRQSLPKNAGLPPLPDAVAAAPGVGRRNLGIGAASPPLPNVVAAAPAVGNQGARSSELPAPSVVAAAPSVETQKLARGSELPMPSVVAAAPSVATHNLARSADLPTPNAIAAAPLVATQNLARSTALPMPGVVAAAPSVTTQNLARSADLPMPSVVAAAPPVETNRVETKKTARRSELPTPSAVAASPSVLTLDLTRSSELPTPSVVAAAPPVGTQKLVRNTELPPPSVVAAAPSVTPQNLARNVELPTQPGMAAAPPVGTPRPARSAEGLPSSVIAAALPVGTQNPAHSSELPPPQMVASLVTPASSPVSTVGRTQHLTAAGVGSRNIPAGAALLPMPDMIAAAQPGADASEQTGPVVTYRDGQLTVNAENSTLAAVLKLIAEKTGAVIDLPPGSGQERIFEHAGPGQPNDVLERLLNGSAFNFIIVSSPQHADQPAEVLLSLRGPEAPVVASVQPRPMNIPLPTAPPSTSSGTPLPVVDLTVPENAGSMSPEALGDMMRQKRDELREKFQSIPPQ